MCLARLLWRCSKGRIMWVDWIDRIGARAIWHSSIARSRNHLLLDTNHAHADVHVKSFIHASIQYAVAYPSPSTFFTMSGILRLGPTKSLRQYTVLHSAFHQYRAHNTYMLSNTPAVPTIPINNSSKGTLIIQPTLRRLECRAQYLDILLVPNRRQNIPSSI